ncbi:hypothetical protein FQR65_LT08214 [Abscondita terminalis]|nr:hypothetical protein FQR65_LT08214 [Abscondita terminalis]
MASNIKLDTILLEIGEFGKFQRYMVLLLMFLSMVRYFPVVIYVFETIPVNHRCKINYCDFEPTEYNPLWLKNAVPFKNEKPARCVKFKVVGNSSCDVIAFNTSELESCDSFIYESSHVSIIQDFNLHCDENLKLLSLVGTVNGIAKLIGLPIVGYISDRYGRKRVLIWTVLLSAFFGILRSVSTSYVFFMICSFFDSFFSAGSYATIYVLGSEFVGPEKRTLVSTLQFLAYGFGSLVLSSTAFIIQSWRTLLQVLYAFYAIGITYYWLMPESVRWLLTMGRHDEALAILEKISKINGARFTTMESNGALDLILTEIGEYGRYQQFISFLVTFTTVICYVSVIVYVFETTPVNHRCKIPGCDLEETDYNPTWLTYAVPFKNGKPERCTNFLHTNNSTCEAFGFNTSIQESCDMFIYESTEISIMHDFNLHCDENLKALTFVGTMNGVGKFIGLPIAGFISDKYGRKNVLIGSMLICGIIGLLRSFSKSYILFVLLEFLDSLFCTGIYPSAYVLGSEFVGPKKRTLIAIMQFLSFGCGSIILGSAAWFIQSWRTLLRVLYSFYMVTLVYYWLLPESVRWLLSKKKNEEALRILRKIAKVNKSTISEGKLENLLNNYRHEKNTKIPLTALLKSKKLLIRFVVCSLCWVSCISVYYGLTVVSTTLSGNRYLDFILTAAVDVPANIVSFHILNKKGRKTNLLASLILCSLASLAYIVIPEDIYWIKLSVYLTCKFGIAMAISSMYIVTNEVFPTPLRQTMLSICSMFGRFGNMLAPQLIILVEIWKYLPLVIFATLTGMSAFLCFVLPETNGVPLPDTIKDAENIGMQKNLKRDPRSAMSSKNHLDSILIEIGEFGKYQWFISLLVNLVTAVNFFSVVIYVFETTPVNYRCAIPECDSNTIDYNASWLMNAVPFKEGKPAKCTKFQNIDGSTCNSSSFNNSIHETCNSFVYETPVKSIIDDFNLHCDENMKFLVLVGTMNGLGRVCGLPVIGFVSDRYGRKTVLIWSMVIAGGFGLLRSFANSYVFFIACEFLEAAFSSGGITSGFVLGTEFVGPNRRTLVSAFQFGSYAIGSIILGISAWQIQSWRVLLRVLYSFYLLILSYYWFMPESVRWLLSKNRHQEAVDTLRKAAKVNGKEISQGKLEALLNTVNASNSQRTKLIDLFKSKLLVIRCFMCCFCWFAAIMVYYGLTIVSTTLSGNRYLDFVLTCSIELPACMTALLIFNTLGRKKCLLIAFTISTLSSISYVVVPTNSHWIKLVMYLISKFGVSMSVGAMYTITNELFPTSIRQTLLSICSMCGRIGNILVPQLFLLVQIWNYLPLVIFAVLTGTAGLLTLFFPETKNITLPETIQDSKNIGKKEKRNGVVTENNDILLEKVQNEDDRL